MSRGLNTILVQRVESALGVPLSQQVQIGKGKPGAPVDPAGASRSVDVTASSTQKQETFAHTLQKTRSTQQGQSTQQAARAGGASNISGAHAAGAQSPGASGAAPASAKLTLSPVGRILYSLFEQYPQGAGPLRSDRPLFVDAVMRLRANALASSVAKDDAHLFSPRKTPSASYALPPIASSSVLSGALGLALWQSIVQSGLFYEAQMLRALRGNPEALNALREQPQGRRTQQVFSADPDHVDDEANQPLRALVRQQIELLSLPVIQWQGQAWPGVSMDWNLYQSDQGSGEQAQDRSASYEEQKESQAPWVSDIALNLPELGEVLVRLWIKEDVARLEIVSQQAGALEQATEQLYQRFEQIGVRLDHLGIREQPSEGEGHE